MVEVELTNITPVELNIGGSGVAQIQSDWAQTDNTKVDYIKNKPTIPTKTSELTNDSGFLTEHQSLANYSTTAQMNTAIANHHDNTKQDVISDLSSIRTGAGLGATAVQPAAISDMASKTWVNEQGYLTEHQSLSAYRTSAAQDVIDNGKQDVLISGTNIKTINNTSLLGSGNIPAPDYFHVIGGVTTYNQAREAYLSGKTLVFSSSSAPLSKWPLIEYNMMSLDKGFYFLYITGRTVKKVLLKDNNTWNDYPYGMLVPFIEDTSNNYVLKCIAGQITWVME